MGKAPISAVSPSQDGRLHVMFETGSTAIVNLQPKFQTARFCPLKDAEVWDSARTDGNFVRWYRGSFPVVEVAFDELMSMIVGKNNC